ncbi:MAG: dihydrodipicolinate synthase family protein, partial [Chloroflexi bacterium]|nr:dihydrodipicolinate synthase family protein [Chloroflexota bacterium]
MPREPGEVRAQIKGLLPFVHTPFASLAEVDLPRFRQHLRWLEEFDAKPTCYFCCCGTGEFWSLTLEEYHSLIRAAVEEVGRRVPVVAGVGYGTRLALQFVAAAEQAGAD